MFLCDFAVKYNPIIPNKIYISFATFTRAHHNRIIYVPLPNTGILNAYNCLFNWFRFSIDKHVADGMVGLISKLVPPSQRSKLDNCDFDTLLSITELLW
jgi:hypothetical protein